MDVVNYGDRVVVARPSNRYRGRFAGKKGRVEKVQRNPSTGVVQVLTTIDPVCWFYADELDLEVNA